MPVVATDPYPGIIVPPHLPGNDAFAITPSDTDELATVARAIWVGTTGNLRVKTAAGTTLTFNSVPVGWFDRVRVKQVLSTSTTASNLVGVP
jgi:hypothetical protein